MKDGERQQLEQKAEDFAKANNTYYVDTRLISDLASLKGVESVADIKAFRIIPLATAPGRIDFGFTQATDRSRFGLFAQKFPKAKCNFYVISDAGFEDLLAQIDVASLAIRTDDNYASFDAQIAAANKEEAFRLIAQLAYQLGSSDIHMEPKAANVELRLRVDGTLHPITKIPTEKYKLLLASLQSQASMKWGSDMPQGGRITIELVGDANKTKPVNMRIETIPTLHGEELIVRLLNLDMKYLTLDNAQLSKEQRARIEEIIKRPYGMLLSVGPTGSGKTSMLYSIINAANSPEIKVVTLEDPVEYDLPGTSQIAVHSSEQELFSAKLMAVVRQDPNIIMIGEIRDQDTAKTALQAALTGHLVLSTFHASSAAAAVSRLMDMIGQNPLLASAVRLIMAQRLVRKVCPHCKEKYSPDAKTAAEIKASLKDLPETIYKPIEKLILVRGKGCKECHNYGYLGRMPVIEQLQMTPSIEAMIADGTVRTTRQAIQAQAVKEGMVTLLQDGLMKALAGETTVDEVYRLVEG